MNDTPATPSHEAPVTNLERLETARLHMAQLWTHGSVIVMLLMVVRTIMRPQIAEELWSWALPTIMPTMGLIFSVIAASAIVAAGSTESPLFVRRGFLKLSKAVSTFYLAVLALWVMVGAPLVSKEFSLFADAGGSGSGRTVGAASLDAATAGGLGVPPAGATNASTAPVGVGPVQPAVGAGQFDKPAFIRALMIGNYFLSPLQSLVVALLSAMFFTGSKAPNPPTTPLAPIPGGVPNPLVPAAGGGSAASAVTSTEAGRSPPS
ncbi:MAG: hypothetical protein HZC55_27635 [Verrucomicrobia bacterium]|jgi:hypothetical protein|nr:hypothetical protein [Verrucomicrobiota bacterium]